MSVKVKKRSGQWGIANLFRKNSKFSAFFDKNWPEKYFWPKLSQHAAQLKGAPSMSAKILAFPSLLYRQDSKIYLLPSVYDKIHYGDKYYGHTACNQ